MASFPGMLPGMLMNPAAMQQLRTVMGQIPQLQAAVAAAQGRGATPSGRSSAAPAGNYGYGAPSPADPAAFNAAATGPFTMAAQDRVGPDDTTQQRQQSNLANLMAAINPTARAQQYLTDFNGYQAAQQNMKRGIDPNNPGFDPAEYGRKFLENLGKTTDMGLMQNLAQAQSRGMSPSLDLIKQLMPAASTAGTMYDSSLMKQSDFNGLRPQDAMQLMMQARQRQQGQLPSAPQMQTEAPQTMQMPQMQQMQRGFGQTNPNALQMMAMMRPQMSQMAQPRPQMAAPRFGNVSTNPYSMSMGMRSF